MKMRSSPRLLFLGTIFLLVAIGIWPSTGLASTIPCIDYSNHFHWLTLIPSQDLISGLTYREGVLYYVSYENGGRFFRSIDVSDPLNPQILASQVLGDLVSPFSISWPLLVIGADTSWLHAYDLSDPKHLVLRDRIDLGNAIRDVVISENRAYVSVMNHTVADGIYVVDLTDPSSLSIDAFLPLSTGPIDLGLLDPYLYVSATDGLISIVDISDPDTPQLVNVYDDIPDFRPLSMLVRDELLYVVDYVHGVRIFDVANPLEPILVESVLLPETTSGVAVDQEFLFLSHEFGIYTYRRSEGKPAELLGFIPDYRGPITAQAGFLYASSTGVIGVYDLNTPFQFSQVAGRMDTPGSVSDLVLIRNVAMAADATGGLRVISLEDALNPIEIGHLVGPGFWPEELFFYDNTLYVCSRSSGDETGKLWIVDVANTAMPSITGSAGIPEPATDVAAIGDFVWVVTPSGLLAIDATFPSAPKIVGGWGAQLDIRAIKPLDSEHLIVVGDFPLTTLRVANPRNPQVLDELLECSDGVDIAVRDGRAYVTTQDGRFYVIDYFGNPASPLVVGRAYSFAFGSGLATDGESVYAAELAGVTVLDVRTSFDPQVLGHVQIPFAMGIDVYGQLVVAGAGSLGIAILPEQCSPTATSSSAHETMTQVWFPNPFQNRSSLSIQAEVMAPLRVDIYDVTGRLRFRWEASALAPGNHRIEWNGEDRTGNRVPPGVYFANTQFGASVTAQKLVRVR